MDKSNWLKIKEHDLVKLLEDKLSKEGYTINKTKKDINLDIEAVKDGIFYVVEVKGSEKPDGNFFKPEQENAHFSRGLFQLFCKFKIYGDNAKYVMAIPDFGKTTRFIEQIVTVIKKLGIEIWVIDIKMEIKVYN